MKKLLLPGSQRGRMARRIGQRLEAFRREQLLAQRDLAILLGVRVQRIAAYERGEALPPLLTLWNAAKLLNVRIDSLLSDEPPEVPLSGERVIDCFRRLSAQRLDIQRIVCDFLDRLLACIEALSKAERRRKGLR